MASIAPEAAANLHTERANPHWVRLGGDHKLDHIPGKDGWPVLGKDGKVLKVLTDTGGRPLGLARHPDGRLIIADAIKVLYKCA